MYIDLLPRIKNAAQAHKSSLLVPFSRNDLAIAKILVQIGYLKSAEKKTIGRRGYIEMALRYEEDNKPNFSSFKFMSTPSRHIYKKYEELKPVRQHFGVGVISTSRGIMTAKEARKQKLGGEYLFEIW